MSLTIKGTFADGFTSIAIIYTEDECFDMLFKLEDDGHGVLVKYEGRNVNTKEFIVGELIDNSG